MKKENERKSRIKLEGEKFKPVETKSVDSKNRITLGDKVIKFVQHTTHGADAYQICVGEKGDILLRPVVNIPSKEAWIYRNPKVIGKIRQGLDEARKGDIEKIDDLDKFFKEL